MKPVLAVTSHTHFDHTGSHHEFDERLHRAEADILARPTRTSMVAEPYVDEAVLDRLPPGDYSSETYAVKRSASDV